MSIFEDLIEELKDEHLLEETVIEVHNEKNRLADLQAERNQTETSQPRAVSAFDDSEPSIRSFDNSATGEALPVSDEFSVDEEIYVAQELAEAASEPIVLANADFLTEDADPEPEYVSTEIKYHPEVEKTKMVGTEKEYFRKRAMDEVTGLQMVEHVLSGVEREQMKTVPKPYDDLPVKLALHDFLQDAHDTNTTEHAQAEFRLMQETENWYSALSHRDKHITVAHLRRYCETSRPALSAQALISLARFYRNSPYSESVRSKFDLVMTRLFSCEIEYEQRELLLNREEMIQQLKALYSDWSSIQLYSVDEEDSEILISTLKFEDFITEAENTNSFEELINNDFFSRLRSFKESCHENFFAPLVTARAIESNIRIGNRYIDLLQKEKENSNVANLEEKYGFLHDQAISDATGKTLQLLELLKERSETGKRGPTEIVEVSAKQQEKTRARVEKKPRNKFLSVNKWLLAATIITVVLCGGLYIWAEYETKESTKVSPGVVKVNLENSVMQEYIQTARISDETFFGITLAAWENLNGEKKEELLKKILEVGPEKGFKKVHLINPNGKSVGFASVEKVEVYHQ
jgi:hypothetical protein